MKKVLTLMVVALLCATIAAAQDYLGSISGRVTDEEGHVIPSAKVVVSSTAIMGTRELTSTDNGLYRAVNLPPGIYSVTVTKDNYQTYEHKNLTMRADLNITLNIKLKVGSFEQAITIVQSAPIIDVTETGQKFNFSGEFHRSLPISVRNEIFEILRLVPGTTSPEALADRPVYSVHGTDEFAEPPAWIIDGGNAASQEFGFMNTRINLDIIEDSVIDITKSSAKYQSGHSSAVVIVTKSGGNELAGTLAFQMQPSQWNDINLEKGTPRDTEFYQTSATLGGPIIKDKFWFFGSYRYQHIDDGISRTAEQLANLRAIFPDFEPFRKVNKKPDVFGKVSYQLNDDHNLFLSYQQEWGGDKFVTAITHQSGQLDEESSGYFINSNWNWAVNDNLFVTTSASYISKPRKRLYEDGTRTGALYYRFPARDRFGMGGADLLAREGVTRDYFDNVDESARVQADASLFLETGRGTHDINFGMLLDPFTKVQTVLKNDAFPRTIFKVANDPFDLSKGFREVRREFRPLGDNRATETRTQRYAGYINDSWRVNDRFVIQAGLRFMMAKKEDELDGEAFSTLWTRALSPNIGLSYALADDNKTIIRANYSRHYDTVLPFTLPGSGRFGNFIRTFESDLDLNGSLETTIVNEIRAPAVTDIEWGDVSLLGYSDDFTIGFSQELPWEITLNADYVYRETGGGFAWQWNAIIEDGIWKGPRIPGYQFNEKMTPVSNDFNWRTFNGIDIVLSRALSSRFQLMASYSYADGMLKGTHNPDDPLHYIQPETYEMTSTSVSHSARVNLVYLAPYDIIVGVTGSITQGELSSHLIEILSFNDPELFAHGPPGFLDQESGKFLSNPLLLPFRDYGSTRDEGRWRGETRYNWNLRLGKTFTLKQYRLEASVDIYNIFNAGAHHADNVGVNIPFFADRTGKLSTGTFQQPRAAKASIRLSF